MAGIAALLLNGLLVGLVRRGVPLDPVLQVLAATYTLGHIAGALAIARSVADPLRRALALAGFFLAATALVALVGLAVPAAFYVIALAAVAAVWLFLRSWRRAVRMEGTSPERALPGGGVALLTVAILAVGLVGLAGYQHAEQQTHFLMPEFALLGLLHKDPQAFSGYVSMILEGRRPGAMLDGVQPAFYHFGVHYFLAGLARAADVAVPQAFVAGQQLILIPLLLFHAALAAVELARGQPGAGATARLAVPLALMLLLGMPSFVWLVGFYSESSSASMPLLFLLLPVAAAWTEPGRRAAWALPLLLLLIAGAGLLKLTTGLLLAAAGGYLVLRLLLPARRALLAYLAVCLASVAALAAFWPMLGDRGFGFAFGAEPAFPAVLREFHWALGLLLAASLVEGAAILARPSIRADAGSARALPLLWLLLLPGCWAGLLLIGNLQYVTNARYLFNSVLLMLAPFAVVPLAELSGAAWERVAWERVGRRWPAHRGRVAWVAGLLLVLLFLFALERSRLAPSLAWGRIGAQVERVCARAGEACAAAPGDILPPALAPEIERRIEESPGGRLLAAARHLEAEGAEAFFIPPDADATWDFLLTSQEQPVGNLQFLPALTGRPLLMGLPPSARGVPPAAVNQAVPGTYDSDAVSRPVDDDTLCRRALARGIDRVGIIYGLTEPDRSRLLRCR